MIFRNRTYSVILSYNLILHPVECVKSYFGLLVFFLTPNPTAVGIIFFFNWKTLKNFFFSICLLIYAQVWIFIFGSYNLMHISLYYLSTIYQKKRPKKMKPPMLKTCTTCKHPSVFYWMSYLHKLIFRINQNAVTLHIHIGSFSVVKCASKFWIMLTCKL